MKIDIQWHCIPESYIAAIRGKGNTFPEKLRIGSSGREELAIDAGNGWVLADQERMTNKMIQDMDDTGRDVAVLSVFPWLFHYDSDVKITEETAKQLNDGIAGIVKERPDRFVGMATVPLQNVASAIKELERAVNQLGMRAVDIGSNVNGMNLNEPELFPFFQKAQDLGILVSSIPAPSVWPEETGCVYATWSTPSAILRTPLWQ